MRLVGVLADGVTRRMSLGQTLFKRRDWTGSPQADRAGGHLEGGMKNTEKLEKIQLRDLPPAWSASLSPGKLQKTIDMTGYVFNRSRILRIFQTIL